MARAVAVMARTAAVIAWRGRWQVTARAVAVMVRAVAGDGEGGAGDGEDGPWQNPGQHTQRGKIPSLVAHSAVAKSRTTTHTTWQGPKSRV